MIINMVIYWYVKITTLKSANKQISNINFSLFLFSIESLNPKKKIKKYNIPI